MILRIPLRCSGCHAHIRLRVALGYEDREPFQFACERCGQAIRGTLQLSQAKTETGRLTDLKGAAEVEENEEPNQVFTVDHRFAERISGTFAEQFSPFLAAAERHEPDFEQKLRVHYHTLGLVARQTPILKRLIHTYFKQQWEYFRKAVREHVSESIPVERPVDRERALYLHLEYVMTQIFSSQSFIRFIDETKALLSGLRGAHPAEFSSFLKTPFVLDVSRSLQREAFSISERFLDLMESFQIALLEWDPESPERQFPEDLTIRASVQFHELKPLYVDSYETACRGLTLVLGVLNLRDRGHPDRFAAHPNLKNFAPRGLSHFHGLSHAPKLALLQHSPFESWAKGRLDPAFRNAIGHHLAHFEPATSTIKVPRGKDASVQDVVDYGEFQLRVFRSVLAVHQLNHLIKMLNAFRWLLAEECAPGRLAQ